MFKKSRIIPYLLLLPTLAWVLLVIVYPVVYDIWLSFTNVKYGTEQARFLGLENYVYLFLEEPRFWQAFVNTIIWTAGNLILQTAIGLGGALLLNQAIRGREIIRSIIILPWVIPTIVASLVWRWILEPDLGIFNNLLYYFGLLHGKPIVYLGNPSLAMLSVIIINTWKLSPFAIVLILAALQTIPKELYESAAIDGASAFNKFRYITMPMVTPILMFVGFVAFVWNFNMFDIVWLTTEGGPGNATEILPILIFRKAFLEYRMSEAAAMAAVLLVFLIAVSFFFLRRRE